MPLCTGVGNKFCGITGHPKLGGTHEDHGVQVLAPLWTAYKSDRLSESIVQMLLELCKLIAVTAALGEAVPVRDHWKQKSNSDLPCHISRLFPWLLLLLARERSVPAPLLPLVGKL